MLKLARFEVLRQRLTAALAHQPELAQAFEDALTRHDEQALGAAFEALHAGPREAREQVEALIVDWLFGDDGRIELAERLAGGGGPSVH
jgi:predicted phage gp36 major capsid-like protein